MPAFNAVPGSGVANLSIADPKSYIPSTAGGLTFSVASNVITLPANTSCTTSITIATQSHSLFFAQTKPYTVGPQTVWLWAFNTNRPAYSGPAEMIGNVACSGPAGKSSAALKAPLIFQ